MASYAELKNLQSDSNLQDRVEVAAVIAAQAILIEGTPAEARAKWAASVIGDPTAAGKELLRVVLAANRATTVAEIEAATDAAIQADVDAMVDALVLAQ